MTYFNEKNIDDLDKIYRINLINSCSGYKSANLLGSVSAMGTPNVAVFSSVTHLGSNPPTLGFILRPTTVPRDTYKNIRETGVFTINHIFENIIEDAHHTSARYPEEVSEFDMTNLQLETKEDCIAPFVKGSPVQMQMKYMEEVYIKSNDVLMVVAQIAKLYIQDDLLHEDGFVNLAKGKVATINGLDGYSIPLLKTRFEFQRPKKI
jgi:flavin reductase (DIM6/NTAB) family NADH-FMN oxidoreductase RutF